MDFGHEKTIFAKRCTFYTYFCHQIDELARTFKGINHTINDENTPLPANQLVAAAATNTSVLATKSLLSVQHKNLNPSVEMKRMFGSKVVQLKQ